MSTKHKQAGFQTPVVNWLGNWGSSEHINQAHNFVKASSITRQSTPTKSLKFYIDVNSPSLPPKKPTHSVSSRCSTRSSMSPTAHLRSSCPHHQETLFHKCETNSPDKQGTPITIHRASSFVANTSNPYRATIIQPCSGFSSIPSSRRSSINSPNSFASTVSSNLASNSFRPESPFTSIETIAIQNPQATLKDRSVSRAKYEDFRNQRATRSYTPTVVNITSNRSNPYQGGVSIIFSKRNLKVYLCAFNRSIRPPMNFEKNLNQFILI